MLSLLSPALVSLEISVRSKVKILQTWENPCLVLCKEVMALDFSKYKTCFASQQNPVVSVWKKEQLSFYNDVS